MSERINFENVAKGFLEYMNKERAAALREVATDLIDWDAMRGDVALTPEIQESHRIADYLMRRAEWIEGEV